MSKRSGVKIHTTVYQSFKGVDFTTDPSLVDRQRSPMATNMIGDDGGAPEKRPGYKILHKFSAKINGIHTFKAVQGVASNITCKNILNQNVTLTVDAITMYKYAKEEGSFRFVCEKLSSAVAEPSIVITINGRTVLQESYTTLLGNPDPPSIEKTLKAYGIVVTGLNAKETDGSGVWRFTITLTLNNAHKDERIVHSGTNVYKYTNNTATLIASSVPNARSVAINIVGKMWMFTGNGFYVYDGVTMSLVRSGDVYVPTTVIGCVAGDTPGGSQYEGINYLSNQQRVGFLAVEGERVYQLPYTGITSVDKVEVNGNVAGSWQYTVDTSAGKVTFTTAPTPPSAGAADNVFITFTKKLGGYGDSSVIDKCDIAVAWGLNGAEDRIVCTGADTNKNRDYISAYNDPTYFPDTNYQVVGTESVGISGYRKYGGSLLIIKEDNGIEPSVYSRSASLNDDGDVRWSTYACLSGVGGISKDGYGNIADDQLVLTGNGVYAITSNSITAEKIAEQRSIRINPKLTKENLKTAKAVSFRNMLYLFMDNGNVYILDGKHAKTYESNNITTFTYEGYYWQGINASAVGTDTSNGVENMYFGMDDGSLCEMLFDDATIYKYADELYCTWSDTGEYGTIKYTYGKWYDPDGVEVTLSAYGVSCAYTPQNGDTVIVDDEGANYYRAIKAVWATKADDDGDPMILKTLLKKGNAITMKPYMRSSGKICIRTDKDAVDWKCNELTLDIFDWEDIDFTRFTFNVNDAPREIPFNRKVKNYKRLQIIVRNENVHEGFGIYGIVKHYVTGNFAKR